MNKLHWYFSSFLFALSCSVILTACVSSVKNTPPKIISDANFFMQKGIAAYQNSLYFDASTWFDLAIEQYQSFDDQHSLSKARLNQAQNKMAYGQDVQAQFQLNKVQSSLMVKPDAVIQERLDLLLSSYFIRQKKWNDAKIHVALYIHKAPFLENRIKISLATRERNTARQIRKYKSLIQGKDVRLQAQLQRFELLHALQKNPQLDVQEGYSHILATYRAFADKAHIAEALEEWGTILLSQQRVSAAAVRLERALRVRVMMHDTKSSHRILKQLQAITPEKKKKQAYRAMIRQIEKNN